MLNVNALDNSLQNVPPPAFAEGGKVSKKLTPAHFSPSELNILDHLQGGKELSKKNGVRHYAHLEELLRNPHLRKQIFSAAKTSYAEGGHISDGREMHDAVHGQDEHSKLQQYIELLLMKAKKHPESLTREEMDFLAANGVNGDREVAMIGPYTHNFFDHLAGHKTRNENTGLPEYWSLGSALKGMWRHVKGNVPSALARIGQEALPQLAHVANHYVSKYSGGNKDIERLGHGLVGRAQNHVQRRLEPHVRHDQPQVVNNLVGRANNYLRTGLNGFSDRHGIARPQQQHSPLEHAARQSRPQQAPQRQSIDPRRQSLPANLNPQQGNYDPRFSSRY